jgi:ABC-2 type transport system ATP-binding protein
MTAPSVRLAGLTKTYGDVRAVDELSLEIAPGEVVALLGPNGAGKSTTVDVLLGLTTPDRGTATLFGGSPREACAAGRVGAMLQSGGLLQDVTVRQLLELLRGLYPAPLTTAEALERAGVADLADRRASLLSGGQQQRVRFACALLPDPDLLVLDEPTAAMDVQTRLAFWASMRAWVAGGRTLLFATHYLQEADDIADRVVLVRAGRVVADGTAAHVKALVGGRTLAVTLPHLLGSADPTGLADLPGVTSVGVVGTRATLRCADSDAALRALLAAHPDARDVEISAGGLEEAFLALTADAPHPEQAR